ncbi:hypothetical protein wNo_06800 [Wolbachia endosymbiont of Drosophila simulans wNo]|uniref:hypothetical protein n=1 Tax=Wolbachia endosymbiont of Drosophila simulans TaxID=77038 RepID=UPI0002D25014|nr:hypothetical protein [Wolbachia endosymbiont of Drosophila simulans]AGJ99086.1 hypothetical protein wNo_06800 [Wolbachia endosymbiont of Drosophila simulans wNo]
MPSTNQINRELVKAFNSVLLFDETFITNLTVEEDHIVLSFDKNMNIDQCREYLINMRGSIVEEFCGSESAADDLFYTDSFPFNFNQGKWTTDSSKHRFSVPIEKEVVRNLKYLLANSLVQFTTNVIMESYSDQDYVDDNTREVSFDRKSYLYCIRFKNRELQNSLVNSFSSKVKSYKNGPKKTKDFLEEKGSDVYIKKGFFDNPQFIKDVVMDKVSLTYRNLEMSREENETIEILKFAMVDLIRKSLPHLPIDSVWHASHKENGELSILAPIVDCGDHVKFLNEKEVDHINNKVFGGTKVFRDVKNDIAERGLPTYGAEQIYAIDFANPDIAYCVMDKITESSVINKDYKLSIDPARVPAIKPQALAPSEKVRIDGPSADTSADSGFGGSPKNSVIGKSHTGNSRKLLRLNYYDEDAQRIKDDNSAKDSGFGASSARSFSNQPEPTLDQPSVSQSGQCSPKKRTSISKNQFALFYS